MIKKYEVYEAPDGTIYLDWNETLWKFGYPYFPKYQCKKIAEGISEGGMALPKLYAKLKS